MLKQTTLFFILILALFSCQTEQDEEKDFDEGIQDIDHIVVVYMENHSFDNLFGEFEGADGLDNAKEENIIQVDENGEVYDSLPEIPRNSDFPSNLENNYFNIEEYIPSNKATPDVTHRFYHQQIQIDSGKMDKFAAYNSTKGLAMGHYKTKNLPLYPIAKKYTLLDSMFQSAFGGSYFNHIFLIAGAPAKWEDAPDDKIAKEDSDHQIKLDSDGKIKEDGIVTPDGYIVNHVFSQIKPRPHGADSSDLAPPHTRPTIGERMSDKDVSWAWYSQGWDSALDGESSIYAYNHEPFAYFDRYGPDTEARKKHLKDETDYIKAAKEGELPNVSFVKPGHEYDEHPGSSAVYPSEKHAVNLINAALDGPQADSTLVILTYDENGGFWDHVAPPEIDRFGPGARIPGIIIGPFAKKGHVDHTQYETVSILSFIEKRWGLEPLTDRDKNANPFKGALEFKD